jgi:CRISPR-associated protein Csm5
MQGDVVRRLAAVPLTPIHVGDGSVLAAEEWRLGRDGRCERFSPAAVLRSAPERTRADYVRALEQGQLKEAQTILRNAVRPEHVLERIAVGPAARRELEETLGNPLRKGDIRPMIRTGGRPFFPGSSIKGALRTALLSSLVPQHRAAIDSLKERHRTPRGTIASRASNEVQALLLGHANPDQDPFRFVEVSDLLLPPDSTGAAQPAEKMQMIFERVLCWADGAALPWPTLEIRIEERGLAEACRRDPNGRKTPSFALRADPLWKAVNDFHWKLLDEERRRFFEGEGDILQDLAHAFTLRLLDGTLLREGELRARPDVLLLRLGRFGQFESKSLEDVREGWNARAKPPRGMREGNTRNLAKLGEAGPLLPFGWLLLLPEELAEKLAAPPAPAARAAAAANAPRTAPTAAPSTRARRSSFGSALAARS